ncbi:hypothetical protein [Aestuariicoccus sp. MJ-SS9]|uniref:hypothetical protein n=1 Tax=Aestuariicoccus sp. MJ-SS9 TaxID=3079855 RepID=UPI00290F137E|nr:hypothetical protein [Aestuariicoccus sp. MJ-SS9]MDU8909828.1 hypothetical protein [Aestuariicoccus sp. MJ-SS9]
MDIQVQERLMGLDAGRTGAERVFVVSANDFVAQDAADIVGDDMPGAEVRVFSHPNAVADAMAQEGPASHDIALVIAPRWELAGTRLVDTLAARGGILVMLTAGPMDSPVTECRTITGSRPHRCRPCCKRL